MIQWIVGEGSASHYFADLAIAGTFPPSNGGILPANSTYLLWYILCPDQHHSLVVEPCYCHAADDDVHGSANLSHTVDDG